MEDPDTPQRAAIIYALLILGVRFIATQADVFCLWYCRRCYERSRGEMITMLYEKTLSRKIISEALSNDTKPNPTEYANDLADENEVKPNRFQKVLPKWARRIIHRRAAIKKEEQVAKKPATMGKILNLMK